MKNIPRWLTGLFSPKELQGLDAAELLDALSSPSIARIWLHGVYQELKQMNIEIDRCLLTGRDVHLTDLCARRRAYQDVLTAIKSAKQSATQAKNHNPREQVPEIDLDRVTV